MVKQKQKVDAIQTKIKNQHLLNQALTHRSYVNEHPHEKDNERLEFLGDAILGFLVGELLYEVYPDLNEAQLTRMRSALVNANQLSQLAKQLGIGDRIRLGKGADRDGGRDNPTLLSDTFEALIAAYYLDTDISSVRRYLKPLFLSVLSELVLPETNLDKPTLVDPKNQFQQWALEKYHQNPEYTIAHQSGPDHAREFTAQVSVQGTIYGTGKGSRKQEAEKAAAKDALHKLGLI
jgi:ribonuclease III